MANTVIIPIATEIEYRYVRREKRVVIAKALWDRINVEYQPTKGGLTMNEWIKILLSPLNAVLDLLYIAPQCGGVCLI